MKSGTLVVLLLPRYRHASLSSAVCLAGLSTFQHSHIARKPFVSVAHSIRSASTASSTRWKTRQSRDSYARDAKVAGLKSRAAFKLLEINDKYRLFRKGDTVVDLGYAPGSWSQVAVAKTSPGGRVVGIDVIPTQPPRGANALQGNFLNPATQEMVREFVRDKSRGRVRVRGAVSRGDGLTEEDLEEEGLGILELERRSLEETRNNTDLEDKDHMPQKQLDEHEGRVVDVVLSDMSAPWPLVTSTWVKSVSNPYIRMMNTSGVAFRDHAGSMDLCLAALTFCFDTLRIGGNFLCKYYAGSEDHAFELRLKALFEKVHRIKPDASRKESKEAYFVALGRRPGVKREHAIAEVG